MVGWSSSGGDGEDSAAAAREERVAKKVVTVLRFRRCFAIWEAVRRWRRGGGWGGGVVPAKMTEGERVTVLVVQNDVTKRERGGGEGARLRVRAYGEGSGGSVT